MARAFGVVVRAVVEASSTRNPISQGILSTLGQDKKCPSRLPTACPDPVFGGSQNSLVDRTLGAANRERLANLPASDPVDAPIFWD